jgi:hypothetical protein
MGEIIAKCDHCKAEWKVVEKPLGSDSRIYPKVVDLATSDIKINGKTMSVFQDRCDNCDEVKYLKDLTTLKKGNQVRTLCLDCLKETEKEIYGKMIAERV